MVQRVITEKEYAAAQTLDDKLDGTEVLAGRPRLRHIASRRDLLAQLSESAFLILTRGTDCVSSVPARESVLFIGTQFSILYTFACICLF